MVRYAWGPPVLLEKLIDQPWMACSQGRVALGREDNLINLPGSQGCCDRVPGGAAFSRPGFAEAAGRPAT
jgi:hypothetical protein